jgi:MFS family permease
VEAGAHSSTGTLAGHRWWAGAPDGRRRVHLPRSPVPQRLRDLLVPLLYVGTNIAYLVLALPLGRLADRYGRGRVLVLGHVALLGAYVAAAAPATGAGPTVLALVLLGAFYGATDGVLAAVAAGVVPSSARASGIAAAQTVVALGRLIASAVFGLLWFAVGPTLALTYVAIGLVLTLPCALLLVRQLREVER